MKPIKDYASCYNQLGLDSAHLEVYARRARVKRSLARLKNFEDAGCRTRLKQYYKIHLQQEPTKTRSRDLLVLPFMVNKVVKVYNGKFYLPLKLVPEYLGHYVSEFVPTRTKGTHSSKGKKPIKRT